ncbi:hypothetical protein [Ruegeria pomeroyi]|uniref:hypothetical protein n=1 Tax=Ruegeria pomeroyi TaxID=89184 RepID=UPI001F3D12DF|nr:hypothetical protein [Ruegeria pomeroyi]
MVRVVDGKDEFAVLHFLGGTQGAKGRQRHSIGIVFPKNTKVINDGHVAPIVGTHLCNLRGDLAVFAVIDDDRTADVGQKRHQPRQRPATGFSAPRC